MLLQEWKVLNVDLISSFTLIATDVALLLLTETIESTGKRNTSTALQCPQQDEKKLTIVITACLSAEWLRVKTRTKVLSPLVSVIKTCI